MRVPTIVTIFLLLSLALGSRGHAQVNQPTDSLNAELSRLEQIPLSDTGALVTTSLKLVEQWVNLNGKGGEAVSRRILAIAKERNSEVLHTTALSSMGQYYRLAGNPVRAIRMHQEAVSMATSIGNLPLTASVKNQMANIYKDRQQYYKALELYYQAKAASLQGNVRYIRYWPLVNLAFVYLNMSQLDSALFYAQASEREFIASGRSNNSAPIIDMLFGSIYSKLNRTDLAETYFRNALAEATKSQSRRYINDVANRLAGLFLSIGKRDSALHYGCIAVETLKGDPMFNLSQAPAKLMASMYTGINCDSSLKYAHIAEVAGDSLNNLRANQQFQALTFEDELRQIDAAKEKEAAEQTRVRNIQYAFMALGIVVVLMLYFILSRSFITNVKAIEYAGVLALLIVFEFFNLLLHPMLEQVTHHNPALMLLCLVALAAGLVPLHHKVEKWAITALVAKNKTVRLAAARRTLEELS